MRPLQVLFTIAVALNVVVVTACGGGGDSDSGNTTPNATPMADAGRDQSVLVQSRVFLDGSRSTDAEGNSLIYAWNLDRKPAGSLATLENPNTLAPSFTADLEGAYSASLVVSDGQRNSAPDTVDVVAQRGNVPPVANPGENRDIPRGKEFRLDGSASSDANPGDILSFQWALMGKPPGSRSVVSDPTLTAPSFVPDLEGNYVFRLVVNDGQVNSAPSDVTLRATNSTPTAVIKFVPPSGPSAKVSSLVVFDGTDSTDPNNDPLTYLWTLQPPPGTGVPAVQTPQPGRAQFTPAVPGVYRMSLKVSDGKESSTNLAQETVTAIALTPPTAKITITANGNPTVCTAAGLSGTTSTQGDGGALSYAWSIINGPPQSNGKLASPTSSTTLFTPDLAPDSSKNYTIQLRVSNFAGSTPLSNIISTIISAKRTAGTGSGESIFNSNNCGSCHRVGTFNPGGGTIGPNLGTGGTRDVNGSYSVSVIKGWLNPAGTLQHTGGRFAFSDCQFNELVSFINSY
jgi:mono/diheme cytochrome c family protein